MTVGAVNLEHFNVVSLCAQLLSGSAREFRGENQIGLARREQHLRLNAALLLLQVVVITAIYNRLLKLGQMPDTWLKA